MRMSRYSAVFVFRLSQMSLRQYLKNESSDQSASDQRALRGAAEYVEALQTQQDELKQKGRKRKSSERHHYYFSTTTKECNCVS